MAALPRGLNNAIVVATKDGCGLRRTELEEGRSIAVLLELSEAGVAVTIPGTTLPRLVSKGRTGDRFTTERKQVPISAQNGQCTAMRTQYYEGLAVPPSAYHVIFHNQDDMKMGECGVTPLPCQTTATLSIRFCPSPSGCADGDLGM